MKSSRRHEQTASTSADMTQRRTFGASIAIFVVGFGLFITLLANTHIMAATETRDAIEAEELASLTTQSTKASAADIAKSLGRLKYNGISVALRDTGVTVDSNDGHALVAYADESTGPDTVTIAAQRSRALSGQLDPKTYSDVTVVATDAQGAVKAAVTNATGKDESAIATSDLLGQAQSYLVSPALYAAIASPSYARTSDAAPANTNSDALKAGAQLEVTKNAVSARIDASGKTVKVSNASAHDIDAAPAVSVVDAKIASQDASAAEKTDGSAAATASATSSQGTKTDPTATTATIEPVNKD